MFVSSQNRLRMSYNQYGLGTILTKYQCHDQMAFERQLNRTGEVN